MSAHPGQHGAVANVGRRELLPTEQPTRLVGDDGMVIVLMRVVPPMTASAWSLLDDARDVVNGWNARFDSDYQSARANPVRDGEPWDFPGSCPQDGTPES